jgi:hypothetical protein
MAMAKAARQVLRQPRYDVERIRKDAKAPLLAIGKKLDVEAARITAEIMKLEEPINQQIKNEEDRKEREREAAAAAEAARLAAIQVRLAEIRQLPIQAAGKTVAHAQAVMDRAYKIDLHGLGPEGDEALNTAMYAIKGVIAEREQYESEQARIASEREELARLRAEQEQRDRVERERLAEESRRAREEHAAELARQQEELAAQRAEQDRLAQVERDRLAAERAEQDRLAKIERDRQAAEQAKLDQQRAELVAEQERAQAQRAAEEAAKKAAKRPTDEEIVAVLAAHYKTDAKIVRKWLGWQAVAAA